MNDPSATPPQASENPAQAGLPTPAPDPATPTGSTPDAPTTQADAWKEKALRYRADYDNLQRRVQRDAAAERDRAKARVLEGFLPVYELAQMAAHQAELHPGPVTEGVVLMAREFSRLLEREGLVPIGKVGDAFDARLHEAIATEAAEGVPKGHISRVVLPGYMLADKVLRVAKVCVAP